MKKILASLLLIATVFAANAQTGQTVTAQWKDGKVLIINELVCNIKFTIFNELGEKLYDQTTLSKKDHTLIEPNKKFSYAGIKVSWLIEGNGKGDCVATTEPVIIPIPPVTVLPIKFRSVTSKWIDSRTLLVTFDVAEVSGVNVYKVRISRDGINYTERAVVFPETTKADHIYTAKISF